MNTRHVLSYIVAPTLAVSLFMGTATPAWAVSADLEAQVSEAQTRLSELYGEAEQCNYDLEQTVANLNETIKKIDKTADAIVKNKEELAVARKHLSAIIADEYKLGDLNIFSLIFDAKDFEDLISRVTYANKVAAYHADAVNEVKRLEKSLEEKQSTYQKERKRQEKLVADQKEQKQRTDKALDEAQAYYDQLSEELQVQIAEEQAAAAKAAREAAAAAAAEAERLAEQERETSQQNNDTQSNTQSEQNNTQTDNSDEEKNDDNANTNNTTKKTEQSQDTQDEEEVDNSDDYTDEEEEDDSYSNPVSTDHEAPASVTPAATGSASSMVAQAYTAVGSAYRYSGYVWTGDPSTSAFTCSGLVDFALGRPTNSSSPGSLYGEVSNMKTSISELSYGDLVFTGNGGIGHVGIYVGDGCFLDSSWDGVSVRAINESTFIGGGSIF